jgi:hypothetical protein
MNLMNDIRLRLVAIGLLVCFGSCHTQRQFSNTPLVASKTLLATCDKGWLRYKIYQLPIDKQTTKKSKQSKNSHPLVFSIMIINQENGDSPLRRICGSLEQYNALYEYLLNQAKNDLALVSGTNVLYPSYCSFENNYNAFPFETLNVGFSADALARYKVRKSVPVRLLYMDRVFAHDTVTCDINKEI